MPATDDRYVKNFSKNISRIVDGVRAGLFIPALEAACRVIVNESKNANRPLAWNDVTGNLRASISFQIEGHRAPYAPVMLSRAVTGPDLGRVYNLTDYVSGKSQRDGDYAVVYAPPEYAVHVEMKSTRSVLIEPIATVKAALTQEMGREAKKAWEKHLDKEITLLPGDFPRAGL